MKKDKFVPMKVWFDEQGFKLAEQTAKKKLEALNKALEWCSNHINTDKIDRHKFIENMLIEFGNQLQQQKGGIINAEISLDKLAFLLDIRMDALVDLKNQYDSIRDVEVEVVNDDYKVEVSQEPFIRYTENEEENERVIRGNNLIKALELISKYVQIYPLTIQQATSNYLTFDMRTQTYKINL